MKFATTVFFALNALPGVSHGETFGNWESGISNDGSYLYAATVNDSGNLLGQYCELSSENCMWVLGMSTSCEEGDKYAVLANSDAGASHLNVYCSAKLEGGLYRYIFTEFDSVQDLVTKGMRVGFAVPLAVDRFRVVRFDLETSNQAIEHMYLVSKQAREVNPSGSSGTRDIDL